MTNIRPFIRDASFDPELVHVMSLAYDNAKTLIKEHDTGSQEALAIRIITLASCGEHDPDKLAAAAIQSFAALHRV